MRSWLTFTTVLALVAALLVVKASAAATLSTQSPSLRITFCGQLKNGPANDWSLPRAAAAQLGLPARFRGRTWTVYVRGTPCAFAMKNMRPVLRQWAKTNPGARIPSPGLSGPWICGQDRVIAGGRGGPGGSCVYLPDGRRFTFRQLGSLTLSQIKRLVATGKLSTG